MEKRGSFGEWILVVLLIIALNVGTYFLVTGKTYTKEEADGNLKVVRDEAFDNFIELKNNYRCGFVNAFDKIGKTPQEICSEADGRNAKFVVIYQGTRVYSGNPGPAGSTNVCEPINEIAYISSNIIDDINLYDPVTDMKTGDCTRTSVNQGSGMLIESKVDRVLCC